MSKFFHELANARQLFETMASEMKLDPFLVEKDYWIMHCLWGLQQNQFRFEMKGGTSLSKGWRCIDRFSEDIDIAFVPPEELPIEGTEDEDIQARNRFYDELSEKIHIPEIQVSRDKNFDDDKARNCGIRLTYNSQFTPVAGVTIGVLLEIGFAKTTPNEPRSFTSWAIEKALEAKMTITDNRAPDVPCFNPEYTFVEKLQTISRRFRQYRDRKDPNKDRPAQFLRHYYDLYRLIEMDRVTNFIGSEQYTDYRKEKIRGSDLAAFNSTEPFRLLDKAVYSDFEKGYEDVKRLLWGEIPTFEAITARIRSHSEKF